MRSNFPLKEVRPPFKEGSSDNFLLLVQFSIMDKIGRKIGKGVCVSVKKEYQAMIIKSQPPCITLFVSLFQLWCTEQRWRGGGQIKTGQCIPCFYWYKSYTKNTINVRNIWKFIPDNSTFLQAPIDICDSKWLLAPSVKHNKILILISKGTQIISRTTIH